LRKSSNLQTHYHKALVSRCDAVASTIITLDGGAQAWVTVSPSSTLLLLPLDGGNKDTHAMKQHITTMNGNNRNINHQHQTHTNNESINIMMKIITQKDARIMAFKASEEMPLSIDRQVISL